MHLFLQGKEVDGPKLDPWHLNEMLKHLENSDEIEEMNLIQLEFGLFPILEYENESSTQLLYKAIMTKPNLFNELIRLAFKPKHGKVEESTDISKRTADTSRSILRKCKKIPGTQDDGSVDEKVMVNFIHQFISICILYVIIYHGILRLIIILLVKSQGYLLLAQYLIWA